MAWENNDVVDEKAFEKMFELSEEESVETSPPLETEQASIDEPVGVEEDISTEEDFENLFEESTEEEDSEEDAPEESETVPATKKVPSTKKAEKQKEESTEIDVAWIKSKALYEAGKYGIEIEDDVKWDEETYAELLDQIDDIRLEEKYLNLKGTNENIQLLLDIAEKEGDITPLLSLIGENREFNEIDTSTTQGKIEKITQWYQMEGKKKSWIDHQIKLLQKSGDEDALDEALDVIDEESEERFQQLKKQKIEEAEKEAIRKEQVLKSQVQTFGKVLVEKAFKPKEVDEMVNFIYNDKKYRSKDGKQTLSEFDYRIMLAKNSPEELADLVLFLKDKEMYNKKVSVQKETKSNVNTFKAITKETLPKATGKSEDNKKFQWPTFKK